MNGKRYGRKGSWPSLRSYPEIWIVVSIGSGYGLDDRAIEVRSPAEAKEFVFYPLCPEAHPASCTMGTGGPFLGAKVRPGRDADHSLI
jgi:hypothetical protein